MNNARKHYKKTVYGISTLSVLKGEQIRCYKRNIKNANSYWNRLKDSVSYNQPTDITVNTFTKYILSQLTIQMTASSSLTKILNILIKDF